MVNVYPLIHEPANGLPDLKYAAALPKKNQAFLSSEVIILRNC